MTECWFCLMSKIDFCFIIGYYISLDEFYSLFCLIELSLTNVIGVFGAHLFDDYIITDQLYNWPGYCVILGMHWYVNDIWIYM